jgi:hypothetical protein
MEVLLATGHTWSGGGGGFTVLPVLGALFTIVLVRSAVSLRLSVPVVAGSVVLGTTFALIAEAVGVSIAAAVWLVGALSVGIVVRHARGLLPRNGSD